tara:strand:- start:17876 stop:19081 length:1206 start_codon:yes stop_codon:yes gene_type:complete
MNKSNQPEYAELILRNPTIDGFNMATFEGKDIKVFGGIEGEVVCAKIFRFRKKRKHHTEAIVKSIIQPSDKRISAKCIYFLQCTGCQYQHLEYPEQLKIKTQRVENAFNAYPSLSNVKVSNCIPAENPFEYRNHARFTIRKNGKLGFINRVTKQFIKVDKCLIMHQKINKIIENLQYKVAETTQMSIRSGINTNEYLIQPTFQNPEINLHTGQTAYMDKLNTIPFRISSPSFFQVNTKQAEKLIQIVEEKLDLKTSQILLDAYSGVGTFGITFANKVAKVIAIEYSKPAISDSQFNAQGIDNITFITDFAQNGLEKIEDKIDVAILDPSRSGCDIETIKSVISKKPKKIAYVSCDPETLARDLDIMLNLDYRTNSVQPVDMFPQTSHIECISILEPMLSKV